MGEYNNMNAAEGSLYGHLKSHFSAPGTNTELQVLETIRTVHPDKHITPVFVHRANLIEFLEAGQAEGCLVRDGQQFLARRDYHAPTGRTGGGDGKLSETVAIGLWNYAYDGHKFLVYRIEWNEAGSGAKHMQYILTPKQNVQSDTHCPIADNIIKAAGKWSSRLHKQIYVFDGGRWQKSKKLWEAVQSSYWDNVILDPAMKETLIKDVQGFFDSRSTYEEYGVPWKRGIIFHGTPGCGKTISIKALMNSLQKRDVASLYVKSFEAGAGQQSSIRSIFAQARIMSPCMLIFEDLDSLVIEKVRSYFLNEVDGLEDNNGILMIGSTNHLERLDPGIAKRPSRFDRKYHYKLPGERERIFYCQYWRQKLQKFNRVEFDEGICQVVAQLTEGFSFAYLKELFVQTLLAIVGGRADVDDDEDSAYVNVTDVAEEVKIVDDSSKLVKDGETTVSTAPEAADEKVKDQKSNPVMPSVDIPSHLQDDPLMRILHKQAKALWKEMDNTDSFEIHGRSKVGDAV